MQKVLSKNNFVLSRILYIFFLYNDNIENARKTKTNQYQNKERHNRYK
jgi:hypothetical protein